MALLVAGMLLFFLPHLVRELGQRQRLIDVLPSEGLYKGLYSLVALLGIVLVVIGKGQAPFEMVWQPYFELRWLSNLLMLPAFILLVAGNLPTSHLGRLVRNPMLLGVVFWGGAHLWSNGDLASMLLFGGFTLWAGFKFVAMGIRQGSSGKPARIIWDLAAILIGTVLYGVVAIFHGQLFGVGLTFA